MFVHGLHSPAETEPVRLNMSGDAFPETALRLLAAYRSGTIAPEQVIKRSYERLRQRDDSAVFISVRPEHEALTEARELSRRSSDLPLYGIPVAVKDNIDVAGLPTTAACPAFSYEPGLDATAVARLRAAGTIVIGKANLDQFATGLVGVRSPYGVPRNAFNSKLVPGGSSSGSAVAVAAGIAPLALGTDTAGSGRVPAGLNNIVGLKPSLGIVPTTGVVPACRTLDCVSVFALTTDDAWLALSVMAGPDKEDAYARARPVGALDQLPNGIRLGVPRSKQRLFFDREFESAYAQSLEKFEELGCTLIETDMQPFYETARLLYEGPWVAERAVVVRELLASIPDAIHPVTRAIIEPGLRISAANAFAAFYRLEELRRTAERVFNTIDMLAVPTAPAAYTVEQVLDDPIKLNSNLGTYTNFVNLLDLCGIAVPASVTANGVPFGITLLAPGGQDAKTASLGRAFHAEARLPYGALAMPSYQLTGD